MDHESVSTLLLNTEVGDVGVVLEVLDSHLVDSGAHQVDKNMDGHPQILCTETPSASPVELVSSVPNIH